MIAEYRRMLEFESRAEFGLSANWAAAEGREDE
jgi:hypothetical protein